MQDKNKKKTKAGNARINAIALRGIKRRTYAILRGLVIKLLSSGKLTWINAWIYTGLYLFCWIIPSILMAKSNPELINARGKFIQKDTQSFDRIFFRVNPLLNIILAIVAGLDAVRFEWSHMPISFTILGAILLIVAFALSSWAMRVNAHFETTIRLQANRDQKVCSSGPYKIARHPGYTAMALIALSNPLVLGSWWGFVPGGLMMILVVIRTAVEDRFLQKKLDGYAEYTESTRYRLCPFIW